MFTGIVEETGVIARPGARMKVQCRAVLEGSPIGSSIAVNGTCLTVVGIDEDGFWADLSPETLARTNLGDLAEGSLVNLERPMALGDRLSGHLVQGHVDGTGSYVELRELTDGNWWVGVRVPLELERYMIHKGSIAVDGISLTIASIGGGVVSIAIIPHTWAKTALRAAKVGTRANIEVDMVAKYLEKLVAPHVTMSA